MSFSPLKKLIEKRLEERGLQQGVTDSKISDKTKEVIEDKFPNFSDRVEILKVKDQKITLKADNSSVAQEIQLNQQQIIETVNEEVKDAEVEEITFKSN